MGALTLSGLRDLAQRYDVPVVDALCIALNLHGLCSSHENPRIRYQFVPLAEEEPFLIITPTGVSDSPFRMVDGVIWLDDECIGRVPLAENDDVVISYMRESRRQLTLNSNSRSTCTGCMFCPNIIEDPADARLKTSGDLERLLHWVMSDHGWNGLEHLNKISISSGCFYSDRAAIEHLATLADVCTRRGFVGTYHILSSVIRSRDALRECVDRLGRFHLTVTYECSNRRSLLLKDTKADLTLSGCLAILDHAAEMGAIADVTYIVGLDPYEVTCDTLVAIAGHVSTFPRIQIYQAHNDLMRAHRASRADNLEWFLSLRQRIEPELVTRQVAPRPCENYRGLWYTLFAGQQLKGPRI